jgi:hypothetical protein
MRTPTGKTGRAVLAAAMVVLLALPLATGAADAQPASPTDQARQHFTRGKELFASGEYRGAIGEFAAADKLAPSPLLEFNIALCHERLGERSEAVRRYRLYLERVPDAANRGAVEAKIAQLEGEMKSEADAKAGAPAGPPPAGAVVPVPPVPGGAAPPVGGSPPAGAGAPPPAPTGDAELDRVARIDIRKMRSGRDGPAQGAATPPPGAGPPPPEPRGAAPAGPPPAKDVGEKKKAKPIYKQWWFWVVAGVSAIIIYNIATADSDSTGDRARILPLGDMSPDTAQPGGAVLLRF